MESTVLYEVDGRVATITLNRPEHLNTMNEALLKEALAALEEAASDDAVRAVILTGAGRGFCAGGDLQGMAAPRSASPAVVGATSESAPDSTSGERSKPRPIESDIANLRRNMRTSQLLHDMAKVTFAAINGPCAGAGLAWACAADIRYCSESAVSRRAAPACLPVAISLPFPDCRPETAHLPSGNRCAGLSNCHRHNECPRLCHQN